MQRESMSSLPTFPASRAPIPPRRRALFVLLGAALFGTGIVLLVGKAAGYGHVLHALQRGRPEWLAVAIPAEVLAYAGYTIALRRSARLAHGPSLGGFLTGRLALTSLAAARLVAVGGPGLVYWGLRRAQLSKRGALARVAALNVLLYGVFVGFSALAAVVVLVTEKREAARALAVAWLIGVAVVAVVAISAVGFASLSSRMRRALAGIAPALTNREHVSAFAGATLFWSGDILCLWAGLRAFDVRLGAPALLLAYASSYVVTMLPLALGGVGGPEAALALALHTFGTPLAPALLGVLAYRVVSFWLPTVPGLALLTVVSQLGDRLEQSAQESWGQDRFRPAHYEESGRDSSARSVPRAGL